MTVTLVPGCNPGAYTGAGTNTYLVAGRRPVLVDAATGEPRHLDALEAALGGAALAQVLVTHDHADHLSGAPAIAARWPAAEFARMLQPALAAAADGVDWRPLADGDALPAGDGVLRVVHTPGHAPDHLCFFDETGGVLFCGDLLQQGGTIMIPASRGGDLAAYLASLARVRALAPARALPAHGPAIDDVAGLIDHYLEHRRRRDDEILAALGRGGPAAPAGIVALVYPGLDAALTGAAAESVLAHLRKLEAEGRVRRRGAAWERDR